MSLSSPWWLEQRPPDRSRGVVYPTASRIGGSICQNYITLETHKPVLNDRAFNVNTLPRHLVYAVLLSLDNEYSSLPIPWSKLFFTWSALPSSKCYFLTKTRLHVL